MTCCPMKTNAIDTIAMVNIGSTVRQKIAKRVGELKALKLKSILTAPILVSTVILKSLLMNF